MTLSTKLIEHPLEDVFDIEPNTTIVEYQAPEVVELVQMPSYDEKDKEIEQQYEDIRSTAMNQASILSDELEVVEGRHKARIGEVSATMLNVALSAVREKANLKMHKDKQTVSAANVGTPHTVNQTLVVANREELLKSILGDK